MRRQQAATPASHTVIRDLAVQTGRSYEEAEAAYEREIERLESAATVTTFIPVIARRRAKELLSHRRY
jgi:hypothetical protein